MNSIPPALLTQDLPAGEPLGGHLPMVMELKNTASGDVWLSRGAITQEDFDAIKVVAPWIKYGPMRCAPDFTWVTRSPGGHPDGVITTMEFSGREFVYVAQPGAPRPLAGGMGIELWVEKHQVVLFHAGRTLEILTNEQGDFFIEQMLGIDGAAPVVLPTGFRLRTIVLIEPWLVRFPAQSRVYYFLPSCRSFHGPIEALPPEEFSQDR